MRLVFHLWYIRFTIKKYSERLYMLQILITFLVFLTGFSYPYVRMGTAGKQELVFKYCIFSLIRSDVNSLVWKILR